MIKTILEKRILIEIDMYEDDCEKIYEEYVNVLGYNVLEEKLQGKILTVELIKKY